MWEEVVEVEVLVWCRSWRKTTATAGYDEPPPS
jgi:hypothetical protein